MPELSDKDHEFILDNHRANVAHQEMAMRDAIGRGMSPEDARIVYGPPQTPEDLSTSDMNRILKEVMDGRDPVLPDGPEASKLRAELKIEVPKMLAKGIMPDFVAE